MWLRGAGWRPEASTLAATLRHAAAMAAILAAMTPGAALACGLPLAARITFERALLIDSGGRQQLITSVDLSQAEPNAAVIFPVPAAPTVDQPAGGDALFAYLDEATKPLIERKNRYVWRLRAPEGVGGAAPPAAGVSVLSQQLLGGFAVASLAADDPAALQRWLAEHSYALPAAAEPILRAYVDEGWTFVAVKRNAGAPEGATSPLRISYAAGAPAYPMRLGALSDRPVGVDLFVLSDHRSQVPALETTYAGPLSRLDPAPSGELAALVAGAPYLTRLRSSALDPASLTADFAIGTAPNDEAYRKVEVVYQDVSFAERYGVLSVMLCLSVFSPIAFVIALAMRRRIESLVPKPKKE